MFLDASALTAIMTDEEDAGDLVVRLEVYPRRMTSPLAIWETTVSVARVLKMPIAKTEIAVCTYLDRLQVEEITVNSAIGRAALQAFDRYGKGRHPAALNFGDCFAYACARHHRVPLLFKGRDFSQTDIEIA